MRHDFSTLSDRELLDSLKRLAEDERASLVEILRHLAEVKKRNAHVPEAFPSLFNYCVSELRFSEAEAYRRILAAKTASRYAVIYSLLERGEVTLTTVCLLAPHLSRENYSELLKRASGKSRREVERIAAEFISVKEPPDRVRPLGAPAPAKPRNESSEIRFDPEPADRNRDAKTAPLSSGSNSRSGIPNSEPPGNAPPSRRVQISFSADEKVLALIERARELLFHKYPSGKLEYVLGDAIEAFLEKKDPLRLIARRAKRRSARMRRSG